MSQGISIFFKIIMVIIPLDSLSIARKNWDSAFVLNEHKMLLYKDFFGSIKNILAPQGFNIGDRRGKALIES